MSAPLQLDIITLFVILVNNKACFLLKYDKWYVVAHVYLLSITTFLYKNSIMYANINCFIPKLLKFWRYSTLSVKMPIRKNVHYLFIVMKRLLHKYIL